MKIHHLDCCSLCPLCARGVHGPGHSFFQRGRMVGHCLLVETSDRLVLVDTGFGELDRKRLSSVSAFGVIAKVDLAKWRTAIEQVRALGHRPEDVREIVVTHLDLDHAGGIPDFPWARVHLHASEKEAAFAPSFAETFRYHDHQFRNHQHFEIYEPVGETALGIQGAQELRGLPGFALLPMQGHTRGHSVVLVQGNHILLHAGDAYFHRAQLEQNFSASPFGIHAFAKMAAGNKKRMMRSLESLRVLHREHPEVKIFCAHDPQEFEALAKPA